MTAMQETEKPPEDPGEETLAKEISVIEGIEKAKESEVAGIEKREHRTVAFLTSMHSTKNN